jgi:hypothetical protein
LRTLHLTLTGIADADIKVIGDGFAPVTLSRIRARMSSPTAAPPRS